MKLLKRKKTDLDEDLKLLEMKLREFLQPVPPRTEFVTELYSKILSSDYQNSSKILPINIPNKLLVAGGIIGSILLLITSIRGLISFLGFAGLLINYLQRNSRRQEITPV